jgi:hypothetical protein
MKPSRSNNFAVAYTIAGMAVNNVDMALRVEEHSKTGTPVEVPMLADGSVRAGLRHASFPAFGPTDKIPRKYYVLLASRCSTR